jgi:hypothetical protein
MNAAASGSTLEPVVKSGVDDAVPKARDARGTSLRHSIVVAKQLVRAVNQKDSQHEAP